MSRRLRRGPRPLGSGGSAARRGGQRVISVPIPESELRAFEERLAGLTQPVMVDYFHQSDSALMVPGRRSCPTCKETRQVLEQISDLHDAIRLTVYELEGEPDLALRRGVPAAPGIVIRGEVNRPLRIIGMPAGYFLAVLLQALLYCSSPPPKPPSEITQVLKRLREPITLRVLGSIMHPASADAAMTAFSPGADVAAGRGRPVQPGRIQRHGAASRSAAHSRHLGGRYNWVQWRLCARWNWRSCS